MVSLPMVALPFLALTGLLLVMLGLERVPEFAFAPRSWRRRYLATDAAWYVVATGASLLATFAFQPVFTHLAAPGVANVVERSSPPVQVVVGLLVYDFVAFAVHVGVHRSDRLWSVHKVHHSSLQLDALAATRTHMFEHLVRNVPAQATLFALGLPATTVALVLLVYATFGLLGHSNLRIGGDALELVFVTPRVHRLHHMPATTQHNFATVFTFWDRASGRFVVRDALPAERTGVPGEIDAYPQRFGDALREPLREMRAL